MQTLLEEKNHIRKLMGLPTLSEEQEMAKGITYLELITKFKPDVENVINQMTIGVNSPDFCQNFSKYKKSAQAAVTTFIEKLMADSKGTKEGVINNLYKKFNTGLGAQIIKIAKPIVEKFRGDNGDFEVSKEMVDAIGEVTNQQMVSCLYAIFKGVGVAVNPTCSGEQTQQQTQQTQQQPQQKPQQAQQTQQQPQQQTQQQPQQAQQA